MVLCLPRCLTRLHRFGRLLLLQFGLALRLLPSRLFDERVVAEQNHGGNNNRED
jgi:hypothetical protein